MKIKLTAKTDFDAVDMFSNEHHINKGSVIDGELTEVTKGVMSTIRMKFDDGEEAVYDSKVVERFFFVETKTTNKIPMVNR